MLRIIGIILAVWIVLWIAMSLLGMIVKAAFWLFAIGIVALGGLALANLVRGRS